VLAIVAGYADAVGFLTFGTFAGAMTGNTVLLGIALASAKFADVMQNALIIAAFLAGVAASALLRRRIPLAAILGLEAITLVVAALVTPAFAAPVLAFAMGLQNAAMTHFAGTSVNTVFLTGNLQKLVQAMLGPASSDGATAVSMIVWMWVCYLGGVVLGALACHWTAYPLLLAILPLPAVLLNIGDRRKA